MFSQNPLRNTSSTIFRGYGYSEPGLETLQLAFQLKSIRLWYKCVAATATSSYVSVCPNINILTDEQSMLITIPNCSLMFTLWNGLTMHAVCAAYEMSHTSFCPRRPSMWMLQRPQNKQHRRRNRVVLFCNFWGTQVMGTMFPGSRNIWSNSLLPPRVNQRSPSSSCRETRASSLPFHNLSQDQGCAGVRSWLALDQDLESSTWGSAKSFYAGTQAGSWTAMTQKTGDLCRSLQCQEQIKGWGHAGVERFTLPRPSLWLERAPVLPFHETKAQRQLSLPTRANARRPKKDYENTSSKASH